MTDIQNLAIYILFAALLILAAIILANAVIRLSRSARLPALHLIADAFDGLIVEAIGQINRVVIETYQKTGRLISDTERKQLAVNWYTLIPDTITIAGKAYPINWIKLIVTKEVWEDWVQKRYDSLKLSLQRNAVWVTSQLDSLARDVDASDGNIEFTDKFRVGGRAWLTVDNPTLYGSPDGGNAYANSEWHLSRGDEGIVVAVGSARVQVALPGEIGVNGPYWITRDALSPTLVTHYKTGLG